LNDLIAICESLKLECTVPTPYIPSVKGECFLLEQSKGIPCMTYCDTVYQILRQSDVLIKSYGRFLIKMLVCECYIRVVGKERGEEVRGDS
jgi:hypothetical protein